MIKKNIIETMYCAACEKEIMSVNGVFDHKDKERIKTEKLLFQYVSDTSKNIIVQIHFDDPTLIGANPGDHGFLCDSCKEKYLLEIARRIRERNLQFEEDNEVSK